MGKFAAPKRGGPFHHHPLGDDFDSFIMFDVGAFPSLSPFFDERVIPVPTIKVQNQPT